MMSASSIFYAFLECYALYIFLIRVVNIIRTEQHLHRLIDICFLYIKSPTRSEWVNKWQNRSSFTMSASYFFYAFLACYALYFWLTKIESIITTQQHLHQLVDICSLYQTSPPRSKYDEKYPNRSSFNISVNCIFNAFLQRLWDYYKQISSFVTILAMWLLTTTRLGVLDFRPTQLRILIRLKLFLVTIIAARPRKK